MIVHAYRITQTKYAPTAFTGEGARINGGRWNSIGTRMIYVASSLSLATLELLVHLEDIFTIYDNYSVIPVHFDESLIETLAPASLPDGWDKAEPVPATQLLGDRWVERNTSAVLQVPSVVTRGEVNYLLNPLHSDFPRISLGEAVTFRPDSRLLTDK